MFMDKTKTIHKTAKGRRVAAFLLAAVMALSMIGTGLTAYASDLTDGPLGEDAGQGPGAQDTSQEASSNVVMTTVGSPDGTGADDGPSGDGTTGTGTSGGTSPVAVTVGMTASPAEVEQGGTVSYEVTMTASEEISVDIDIALPDGVTVPEDMSYDGSTEGGGTVTAKGSSIKMTGCKIGGTLAGVGATDTMTFKANVAADAATGSGKEASVTVTPAAGVDTTGSTLTAKAAVTIKAKAAEPPAEWKAPVVKAFLKWQSTTVEAGGKAVAIVTVESDGPLKGVLFDPSYGSGLRADFSKVSTNLGKEGNSHQGILVTMSKAKAAAYSGQGTMQFSVQSDAVSGNTGISGVLYYTYEDKDGVVQAASVNPTADGSSSLTVSDGASSTGSIAVTMSHGATSSGLTTDSLTVYPGGQVYYDVLLANSSKDQATGVTIDVQLPSFVENITCSSGGAVQPGNIVRFLNINVPAGYTHLTIQGKVKSDAAGSTGTARATMGTSATSNRVFETVGKLTGDIRAEISVSGGKADAKNPNRITVDPEELLTIGITVQNNGRGVARMASVSMSWVPGCTVIKSEPMMMGSSTRLATWSLGDIEPGKSARVDVQLAIPASGLSANWYMNPLVSWTDDTGTQSEYAINSYIIQPSGAQAGSLTVTMTQNGTTGILSVDKGDVVNYVAVITNDGSGVLNDIEFACSIPSNLTLQSSGNGNQNGASGGMALDGSYVYKIPSLAAGASAQVSFSAEVGRVRKAGTAVVQAYVDSDKASARSNSLVLRFGKADVWAELTQQANITGATTEDIFVKAGDVITYMLTVHNDGLGDASDITVYDTLPANLTANVSGSSWYRRGQSLEYDLGTVKAGNSRTVTFTATVASNAQQGETYANMVTLDWQGMPDDIDEVESNTVKASIGDIYMNPAAGTGTGTTTPGTTVPAGSGNLSVIALSGQTNSHMLLYGATDTIVVNISYSGLNVTTAYTATVELRNKVTGEMLSLEGKAATGTTSFTPAQPDGTLNTSLQVSPMQLRGQGIVAFVTIATSAGNIVAKTEGTVDEARTVRAGQVSGNLTAGDRKTKNIAAGNNVQVVNTVTYTNLAPGQEYRIVAELFDRATGEAVMTGGKAVVTTTQVPVSGEKAGTSNTPSGNGTTGTTTGGTWSGTPGAPVNQTQSGGAVGNGAAGTNTSGTTGTPAEQPSSQVTQQYETVTQTTWDMSNAKPATAATTFRPTASDGTTEVIFVLNTLQSTGTQYVVKTSLYDMNDNLLAEDSDTSSAIAASKGATVRTQARVQTGVTDWAMPIGIAAAVLLLSCGGAGVYLYYRKRELFDRILRR